MMQLNLFKDESKKKYVYIDENGNYGYNFEDQGTSRYFILTAIVVEQRNIEILDAKLEEIKEEFFDGSEIKSYHLDDIKRIQILKALKDEEFYVHIYIMDKTKVLVETGLGFKKSFLKYSHNLLHNQLKASYGYLDIIADQHGSDTFMKGFVEYFNKRAECRYGNYKLKFEDSKKNNLIQLADLVCGTVAIQYNKPEKSEKYYVFMNFLKNRILSQKIFPSNYEDFLVDLEKITASYLDPAVAEYCIRQCNDYIKRNKEIADILNQQRSLVLEELLDRLRYEKGYTVSDILIRRIYEVYGEQYSKSQFLRKIIAPLRDQGVILSSCKQGFKIPVNKKELLAYTNKSVHIIEPMLGRLNKCRNSILIATDNELDILAEEEYAKIKGYFDYMKYREEEA